MKASVAIALAAVAVMATSGCQGPPPAAQAADCLVVARSSDAVNLDPARANDIESLEVAEQVYGRLVRFAPGRLEPEPRPCYQLVGQLRRYGSWTFELRPDITFHDGTPFDADAVVFSFERQPRADHPAHEPDFVWSRAFHNIRRVTALGRLRVQFEIDRPYAPFLANLAMGPAAIVSPAAVKRYGSKFGSNPVGHRTVPLRRVDPRRAHHAGAQRSVLGSPAAHPLPWCCRRCPTRASGCRRWSRAPPT